MNFNWSYIVSLILGGCVAFSTFALGAFQLLFWLMLGFMCADVIIGFVGAAARKDIDHKTFVTGIPRKVLTLLFFFVGVLMDLLSQTLIENGVPLPIPEFTFALGICIWIIVSEILSIIETMKISGVNVPPFIAEWVEILSKYFRTFRTKEENIVTEEPENKTV